MRSSYGKKSLSNKSPLPSRCGNISLPSMACSLQMASLIASLIGLPVASMVAFGKPNERRTIVMLPLTTLSCISTACLKLSKSLILSGKPLH